MRLLDVQSDLAARDDRPRRQRGSLAASAAVALPLRRRFRGGGARRVDFLAGMGLEDPARGASS
jgi:hypothetical protein